MSQKFQAPRGTQDVLPAESVEWQFLESAFQTVAEGYGYREIRTPTFEDTEVFTRSSGDTSEVVTKQMYTFQDRGERSITLKPEGTAPVVRAAIQAGLLQSLPLRVWYRTPIFRYERPQKGRLREAHQVGLECIGSASPRADVEVIELTVRFYEALGISPIVVKLNSIGRQATRDRYATTVLAAAADWLRDQEEEVQARAQKNPLRLLDTKDPDLRSRLGSLPSITDDLEPESRAHFDAVQEGLERLGIRFELAPDIVRGLDYYSDTVFEVQSDALGAQNSLCGGGRYDGLIEIMGGPSIPAVGVAMGIERALLAREAMQQAASGPRADAFFVTLDRAAEPMADQLASEARRAGLRVEQDYEGRSMRAQMKLADRSQARYALLIGSDELAKKSVSAKHLVTGEQVEVQFEDLVDWLRNNRS